MGLVGCVLLYVEMRFSTFPSPETKTFSTECVQRIIPAHPSFSSGLLAHQVCLVVEPRLSSNLSKSNQTSGGCGAAELASLSSLTASGQTTQTATGGRRRPLEGACPSVMVGYQKRSKTQHRAPVGPQRGHNEMGSQLQRELHEIRA